MRSQYYRTCQKPSEVRDVTEQFKGARDAFERLPLNAQIIELASIQHQPLNAVAKRLHVDVQHILAVTN